MRHDSRRVNVIFDSVRTEKEAQSDKPFLQKLNFHMNVER